MLEHIAHTAIERESLSDAELVGLMRRGDRGAFAAAIKRHNRRLYRVARSVVRDDAEAEDIVQETYVRAFRSLHAFRGDARLSTWLTRIALNEAIDRTRRQRSHVAMTAIDDAENRVETSLMSLFTGPVAADPELAASRAEIRNL